MKTQFRHNPVTGKKNKIQHNHQSAIHGHAEHEKSMTNVVTLVSVGTQ